MDTIREAVQQKYGEAAAQARRGERAGCGCGSACGPDPITSDLYDEAQTAGLPAAAMLASLGCGNPTALAALNTGETVLDLGAGGGIDVLLAARRVGPGGKVFGLEMTSAMLALARENQAKSGLSNVEFLEGEIERIPLPDNSVDVIISNCVINLSADKPRVIAEAFRVLKPGGRFAVSDMVLRGGGLAPDVRQDLTLWTGCVSGALDEATYRALLSAAGFGMIEIEPTRIYRAADAEYFVRDAALTGHALPADLDGRLMSAFVRATKPAAASACCGPACCS